MDNLKIKVCGMIDLSNIEKICALSPDYLGYIFYPKSVRYVGTDPNPDLFSIVPDTIVKTAVFVNEDFSSMVELTEKYGISAVQLHGKESLEVCSSLRKQGMIVIKAIPADQLANSKLLMEYSEVVDYFLFDTPDVSYGGSGRKFDWSNLENLNSDVNFFLSGGITVDDPEQLKSIKSPTFYAVDINSRFESAPGIKNSEKVKNFINEMRYGQ